MRFHGGGERGNMIDYDPRQWQNTSMIKGYTYNMLKPYDKTREKLKGVPHKINDCRIYDRAYSQNGERPIFGWIKFDRILDLYDSMEAGLVPVFRWRIGE